MPLPGGPLRIGYPLSGLTAEVLGRIAEGLDNRLDPRIGGEFVEPFAGIVADLVQRLTDQVDDKRSEFGAVRGDGLVDLDGFQCAVGTDLCTDTP